MPIKSPIAVDKIPAVIVRTMEFMISLSKNAVFIDASGVPKIIPIIGNAINDNPIKASVSIIEKRYLFMIIHVMISL